MFEMGLIALPGPPTPKLFSCKTIGAWLCVTVIPLLPFRSLAVLAPLSDSVSNDYYTRLVSRIALPLPMCEKAGLPAESILFERV